VWWARPLKKKSSHFTQRVSHQNRSPRRDFRALDLLLESARGAGSKSHVTPIGARTTAIHLVNALGGKKARSRRARDIKLPLAVAASPQGCSSESVQGSLTC
jgi:hypothetical protein